MSLLDTTSTASEGTMICGCTSLVKFGRGVVAGSMLWLIGVHIHHRMKFFDSDTLTFPLSVLIPELATKHWHCMNAIPRILSWIWYPGYSVVSQAKHNNKHECTQNELNRCSCTFGILS